MRAPWILCIVEGDGETSAVPTLVNRMLRHLRRHRTIVADGTRVICTHDGSRIAEPHNPGRKLGIEYFVQRAVREKPGGILVVVDAEDRCQNRAAGQPALGPDLLARARAIAGQIPLAVVVANRMFETWFLADFHSLRSRNHLSPAAQLDQWRTPESLGGCKGHMGSLLGRKYTETGDQPRLAKFVSLPVRPAMQQRSPSFFKLYRAVRALSGQLT